MIGQGGLSFESLSAELPEFVKLMIIEAGIL
jgi:hypothetical protein